MEDDQTYKVQVPGRNQETIDGKFKTKFSGKSTGKLLSETALSDGQNFFHLRGLSEIFLSINFARLIIILLDFRP